MVHHVERHVKHLVKAVVVVVVVTVFLLIIVLLLLLLVKACICSDFVTAAFVLAVTVEYRIGIAMLVLVV